MTFDKNQYAILDRFNFEVPPVGITFHTAVPVGIARIARQAALCEMIKAAQQGEVFYAGVQDHTCEAGAYVLGQKDIRTPYFNGNFGTGLQLFDSPRSAARLYHYIPHIETGVTPYIAMAPVQQLTFKPDVLLCLAAVEQTEILLRAMSYRTGRMWSSRYSGAIGCAWLIAYPYLSGQLNYSITGLGHGMKRRHLFPSGRQFVAIPFDELDNIMQSLAVMEWDLPGYRPDGNEFIQELHERLNLL